MGDDVWKGHPSHGGLENLCLIPNLSFIPSPSCAGISSMHFFMFSCSGLKANVNDSGVGKLELSNAADLGLVADGTSCASKAVHRRQTSWRL